MSSEIWSELPSHPNNVATRSVDKVPHRNRTNGFECARAGFESIPLPNNSDTSKLKTDLNDNREVQHLQVGLGGAHLYTVHIKETSTALEQNSLRVDGVYVVLFVV